MGISEGITAIRATVEVAKIPNDQLNRPGFDAAAARDKLHEMLIHAVNAQTALAEAMIEITELRAQLAEFKADQKEASQMLGDQIGEETHPGHRRARFSADA